MDIFSNSKACKLKVHASKSLRNKDLLRRSKHIFLELLHKWVEYDCPGEHMLNRAVVDSD